MKKGLLYEVVSVTVSMTVMFCLVCLVLNIFPGLTEFSFVPERVFSKLEVMNDSLNKERVSGSKKINVKLQKIMNKNFDFSFDDISENFSKKLDQSVKGSEQIHDTVKSMTGIDSNVVISKFFGDSLDKIAGE